MATLNLGSKTIQSHKQFHLHNRPIFAKPASCITFKTPISPSSFSIKACAQNPNNKTPKPIVPENPDDKPNRPFSFLKPALIATVAVSSLVVARYFAFPKPAISTLAPPASVSSVTDAKEAVSDEEKERVIEEQLASNPNDVDGLRGLMEIKIKSNKLLEAVSILDKLIELEPEDKEWPLMKSHLYVNMGEVELAKAGFNEILKKDPFRVEAYHGLVMAASQGESLEELVGIEKKVEEGIKKCKKENKNDDLRDFKLLLAQIRVIEGKYEDALKVYQDLVKEEPRDFRPYLCQGIIYTLLRKSNEAEKCFEKYRRLVPQGHPYTKYFDDNMIATKVFAEKVAKETGGSKS